MSFKINSFSKVCGRMVRACFTDKGHILNYRKPGRKENGCFENEYVKKKIPPVHIYLTHFLNVCQEFPWRYCVNLISIYLSHHKTCLSHLTFRAEIPKHICFTCWALDVHSILSAVISGMVYAFCFNLQMYCSPISLVSGCTINPLISQGLPSYISGALFHLPKRSWHSI